MTRRSCGSSSTTRIFVLFTFGLLRAQRKLHGKHRASFRSGRHRYLSAMRFNNPLRNGKPHARAFPEARAVPAPIEFFEYPGLLVGLDTRPGIGDTHHNRVRL